MARKKTVAKKKTPARKKPVAAKKKPVAKKKTPARKKKVAAKKKPVAKKKVAARKKPERAPARSSAHDLLELLRRRRAARARKDSLPDDAQTIERDQRRRAYGSETESARQHEHLMDSNVRRIQGHYSAQTRHKQGRRDAQQLATRPYVD